METFTEPKPEALKWLSPAKRSRELRGWSGMGPAEWSTAAQTQEPFLRALNSFPQSTVHFWHLTHYACKPPPPSAGSLWSIIAVLWSPKTQSETDTAVEVVGSQERLLVR